MSELQHYYDQVACGGAWKDEDPKRCGCLGSGWFLSQVDTWHKCSIHKPDAPHPESFECEDDYAEHMETVRVEVFKPHFTDDDIPF